MPSHGLFVVRMRYPDLLHLSIPSAYLLSPKDRRAIIRINRHYRFLHLVDFTNYMVPSPENSDFFVPHHDILQTFNKGRHYQIGLASKEEFDTIGNQHKQASWLGKKIFHTVSFDSREDGLFRSFETRYATELLIFYEVDDSKMLTDSDTSFYTTVIDEFVHGYRYITGDYRPRVLEDCREPMSIDYGVIEYDDSELEKSLDERLMTAREIQFSSFRDKSIYDRQPYSDVSAEQITSAVAEFFGTNSRVLPAQEFLSSAKHAAFHTKNFKYAVLEAFISAETAVAQFLREKKLKKGVSQMKLKDWEQEIGIGYMLNIELPMLVDNLSKEGRELLGEVDRVRRMRNDIVHEGKRPTEQEAQFSVKAVEKLHASLRQWGSNSGDS